MPAFEMPGATARDSAVTAAPMSFRRLRMGSSSAGRTQQASIPCESTAERDDSPRSAVTNEGMRESHGEPRLWAERQRAHADARGIDGHQGPPAQIVLAQADDLLHQHGEITPAKPLDPY